MDPKAYRMLAVVRDIEQNGASDLLEYLCAFHMARGIMGEDIGRPLGRFSNRQRDLNLLTIAMAAHSLHTPQTA